MIIFFLDIDVNEVLALLSTRDLLPNKVDTAAVPLVTASAVVQTCNLGRRTYTQVRTMLKSTDVDVLPSWGLVQNFHVSILPSLQALTEPHQGMYCSLKEALKFTLEQIVKIEKISTTALKCNIKLGLDGLADTQCLRTLLWKQIILS